MRALIVVLIVMLPATLPAQAAGCCPPTQASPDSLRESPLIRAALDTGMPRGAWRDPLVPGTRAALRAERGPGPLFVLLAAAVVVNVGAGVDRDEGEYADRWSTTDKPLHAAVAFSMTSAATLARVNPRHAAVAICWAAAAFEVTQGSVSEKDMAASCGGAALAWAWSRLTR